MTWIADAHRQWHSAHGQFAVCPLDCGVGEGQDEPDPEPGEGVRCGHCRNRHWTVEGVKACAGV